MPKKAVAFPFLTNPATIWPLNHGARAMHRLLAAPEPPSIDGYVNSVTDGDGGPIWRGHQLQRRNTLQRLSFRLRAHTVD